MRVSRETSKILVIMELNGLLGFVNANKGATKQLGIYQNAEPNVSSPTQDIYHRPNLPIITKHLLLKHRDQIDIGIWSC